MEIRAAWNKDQRNEFDKDLKRSAQRATPGGTGAGKAPSNEGDASLRRQ